MAKKKIEFDVVASVNQQAWNAVTAQMKSVSGAGDPVRQTYMNEILGAAGDPSGGIKEKITQIENLGAAGEKSGSAIKQAMGDAGQTVLALKTKFGVASKAAVVLQAAFAKILIPIAIITAIIAIISKINDAGKATKKFKDSLAETTSQSADLLKNLKLEGAGAEQKKLLDALAEITRQRNELDEKQIANNKTLVGLFRLGQSSQNPEIQKAILDLEGKRLQINQHLRAEIEKAAAARQKERSEAAGAQEKTILEQIKSIEDLKIKEAEKNEDFSTALSIREKQELALHQKNLNRIAEERKKYIEKFGESGELSEERFNIMIDQEKTLSDLRLANIKREEKLRKKEQIDTAKKAAEAQGEELRKQLEDLAKDLNGIFNLDVFGDSTLLVQGLHDIKIAIETRINP